MEADRLARLENELGILKDNLLNYICQAPQKDANPQWTSARLDKLELDIKELRHISEKYYTDDRKLLEDELAHSKWNEARVDELEMRVKALETRQSPEKYNEPE